MILPYPPSANRYWRMVNNKMLRSEEAKVFKNSVGWIAKSVGIKLTDKKVSVHIQLHSVSRKDGSPSEVRLDLDNCIKVVLDALNGIAYKDDKQVIKIVAELSHAMPDGGLSVTVSEVM